MACPAIQVLAKGVPPKFFAYLLYHVNSNTLKDDSGPDGNVFNMNWVVHCRLVHSHAELHCEY